MPVYKIKRKILWFWVTVYETNSRKHFEKQYAAYSLTNYRWVAIRP